ncbi:MAG TPA: FKBP-type peptidyl-prolyl cis-trans isomerase, partial [Acidobacteriaceae bacterium]|nr:FKBP-type peptidyl-prolyl cis-trans isomerase [Acidobacteriaceae bacterium]
DSSYDHPNGDPISFPYGAHQVIAGWDTGFEGMHVGGKRRLFVPYQLAYGELGRPPVIPPKTMLVFDVELVSQSATRPEPPHPAAAPKPPAPAGAPGATQPAPSPEGAQPAQTPAPAGAAPEARPATSPAGSAAPPPVSSSTPSTSTQPTQPSTSTSPH